jgi:hypothetical protein
LLGGMPLVRNAAVREWSGWAPRPQQPAIAERQEHAATCLDHEEPSPQPRSPVAVDDRHDTTTQGKKHRDGQAAGKGRAPVAAECPKDSGARQGRNEKGCWIDPGRPRAGSSSEAHRIHKNRCWYASHPAQHAKQEPAAQRHSPATVANQCVKRPCHGERGGEGEGEPTDEAAPDWHDRKRVHNAEQNNAGDAEERTETD